MLIFLQPSRLNKRGVIMNLEDWTIHFIRQRDMVSQGLVNYKAEKGRVLCEYKEGKKGVYYYGENLELDRIKKAEQEGDLTFVCLCNEYNFRVLVDNWGLFKQNNRLCFIFLNPGMAEKWIIKPSLHARIADPKTLKKGLRTMYETCMGTPK